MLSSFLHFDYTNNVHFYDEYKVRLRIYQLSAFAENDDKDRISYV